MSATTPGDLPPTPSTTYDIDLSAATAYLKANPSAPAPTPSDESNQAAVFAYYMAKSILRKETLKLQALSPAIATFTVIVLGGIVLLTLVRSSRKSASRFLDLCICAVCLILVWTERVLPVLLASNIAVAHLTWVLLPGSPVQPGIPNHAEFMRSLDAELQPKDQVKDCMICWDDAKPLAKLPCLHEACTTCLQLMGEHGNQTACPLCRKPLFTLNSDTRAVLLQKARVSLYAVTLALYTVKGVYHLRHGDYWSAFWTLLLFFPTTGLPIGLITWRIVTTGEHWWREVGTLQGAPLWASVRMVVASALFVVLSTWHEMSNLQ